MIADYCNQTVTKKAVSSIDEYGAPTYSSTSISARFEYSRKTVINREGHEVISEAVCYTTSSVSPDDMITYGGKDWTVISVAEMPDLGGNISHYEVRL
jgi:hypothetical protein